MAKRVAIGGGMAAGRWAEELVKLGDSQGAMIISAYPEGMVPYDRTLLSKELLDADAAVLRSKDGFPALKTEAGDVMDAAWYAANGITILFGTTCEDVKLESSELVLRSTAAPDTTTTVGFEQLVIATGSRPRTLGVGEAPPFAAPGLWHDDLKAQVLSTEEEKGLEDHEVNYQHWEIEGAEKYGFGSVHTLRDVGDCEKLVRALMRPEDDGQETCFDPVVIVGGGLLTSEVVSSLIKYCPDLPLLVVFPSDMLYPHLFSQHENIAQVYERQMTKNGVKIARGYEAVRLWAVDEVGSFPTLDGPATSLQATRPRTFAEAQPQFKQSRGVVLKASDGEQVWLGARLTILALGAEPSTGLVSGALETDEASGAIKVDASCATSWQNVWAIGDCAAMPHPAQDSASLHWPHAEAAATMARVAAGSMVAAVGEGDAAAAVASLEATVPHMSSKFLDLSWNFYGVTEGEPVLVGDTHAVGTIRLFAVFWVVSNTIVGVFLEGGTPEQVAMLPKIATEKPKIINAKKLKKASLEALLKDPYMLTPPELGVGEFLAELDVDEVLLAFRKVHPDSKGRVKTGQLGEIMTELGADWDEEELGEAEQAMDPTGSGSVNYETFKSWWMN